MLSNRSHDTYSGLFNQVAYASALVGTKNITPSVHDASSPARVRKRLFAEIMIGADRDPAGRHHRGPTGASDRHKAASLDARLPPEARRRIRGTFSRLGEASSCRDLLVSTTAQHAVRAAQVENRR